MSKKNESIQSIALNFIDNKNNTTFTILLNRLKPGLLSFAYKYVKDGDLAQEVVAQTSIVIWEKIAQYKPEYNFSTWVYAIAKNEALGQIRTKQKTVSHDALVANRSKVLSDYSPIVIMNIESIGPSGEQLIKDLYDASIAAIDNLREPYKTVMVEREINQKQLQDIADNLGWNLSTVKTRLRKARKDVANSLSEKYPFLIEAYKEEIE